MNQAGTSWTSFSRAALDWVYPRKCALCGLLDEESPCQVCQSQMEPALPDFVSEGEGPLAFRACVYAYRGRAAQAVRQLKYARSTSLVTFMSQQVAARLKQLSEEDDLIIPVPIHRSRRALRGFNQAEFCAAGEHGRKVERNLLRRIRATRPQAGLTLKEREKNLANAFACSASIDGRTVVLIDDVVTSGHTARECARALVSAGALSVGIVAFCGNLD